MDVNLPQPQSAGKRRYRLKKNPGDAKTNYFWSTLMTIQESFLAGRTGNDIVSQCEIPLCSSSSIEVADTSHK